MLKRVLIFSTLVLFAAQVAIASDREDDTTRTARLPVFKEIMDTPDQGIPHDLLQSAKCIAIIPGDVKLPSFLGVTTVAEWQPAVPRTLERSDVHRHRRWERGIPDRGSSTDLVMLFMNEHALHSLLSDKFKLELTPQWLQGLSGGGCASTDLKLNAEILSYSRSKGIFAGVSLDGAVVQADKSGDKAAYGDNVNRHDILDGKCPGSGFCQAPDSRNCASTTPRTSGNRCAFLRSRAGDPMPI